MKISMLLAFFMISFSALAAGFNEVECEGTVDGKEVYLEIEQPFPESSVFRQVRLTITENQQDTVSRFTVTPRASHGFNELTYWGGGLNLTVNYWPDQRPRWAQKYKSKLRTSALGTSEVNVTCEFPNAF